MAVVWNSNDPDDYMEKYIYPWVEKDHSYTLVNKSNKIPTFDEKGSATGTELKSGEKVKFKHPVKKIDVGKVYALELKDYPNQYVKLTNILKDNTIKGKSLNAGDLAEGVMACALYLLFTDGRELIKTKINDIPNIQANNVIDLIYKITWSHTPGKNNIYHFKFPDVSLRTSRINQKDTVKGDIYLKASSADDLVDPDNRDVITKIAQDACSMVNSMDIKAKLMDLYANDIADIVEIISLGPLDESGTKSDIDIKINGNYAWRISLKNHSKQLGQRGIAETKGISTYKKIRDFFDDYLNIQLESKLSEDDWNKLNIDLSAKSKKCCEVVNELLSGYYNKSSADRQNKNMICLLCKAFSLAGFNNDKDIQIIDISKQSNLNMQKIQATLNSFERFSGVVNANKSGEAAHGQLTIKGKFGNEDKKICNIRFKLTDGSKPEKRLYFEIEDDFKKLCR